MTFRSRKLLDLPHKMDCYAAFPHKCNGWEGCEPAHSDMLIFGRGANFKSPDWCIASVCHNAAAMMDNRGCMDREQRQTEWLKAFKETWDHMWGEGKVKVA